MPQGQVLQNSASPGSVTKCKIMSEGHNFNKNLETFQYSKHKPLKNQQNTIILDYT